MFGHFLHQQVPPACLRSASGPLLMHFLLPKTHLFSMLQCSLTNLYSLLLSQLRKAFSGIHHIYPHSLPSTGSMLKYTCSATLPSDLNSCYVPPLSFPLCAYFTSTTSSAVCCIILITTCLIQERGKN